MNLVGGEGIQLIIQSYTLSHAMALLFELQRTAQMFTWLILLLIVAGPGLEYGFPGTLIHVCRLC